MDINEAKSALSVLGRRLFSLGLINYGSSLSMRFDSDNFIVSKQDALFESEEDFLLLLGKKDYRWKEASKHALLHQNIYKNIISSRFVCYCSPAFICAYALGHTAFEPQDLTGAELVGSVFIYDIKQLEDWQDRAPSEIVRYFVQNNTNFVLLKSGELCVYAKSASEPLAHISTIEHSAKLLALKNIF